MTENKPLDVSFDLTVDDIELGKVYTHAAALEPPVPAGSEARGGRLPRLAVLEKTTAKDWPILCRVLTWNEAGWEVGKTHWFKAEELAPHPEGG